MISLFIRNSCSIYVSHGSIFQQLLYYQSHVPNIAWTGYRYQSLLVLCVCVCVCFWLSILTFIGPVCVFVFECQCQHGPMFVTTSASSRAWEALRQCLPDQLKDATLSMYLKDENTKKWLSQLMQNLSENV